MKYLKAALGGAALTIILIMAQQWPKESPKAAPVRAQEAPGPSAVCVVLHRCVTADLR